MLKFFEKSTGQDITEFLKELKYDAQHVKDINALKTRVCMLVSMEINSSLPKVLSQKNGR